MIAKHGNHHRGFILPVVLFILLIVGLLSAMFAFRVNADLAAVRAASLRMQTRLAAEAGIERAKLLLMTQRHEMSSWYDNPDELHRIIVWAADGDANQWGTNSEELDEGSMVYRFSLVADDLTDDEDLVRFGLTDESSKLNLNLATERQLTKLVAAAVGDDLEVDQAEIVAAILDWRDADSKSRSGLSETEAVYYAKLDKPYAIKNGPFDTVEELLLVKGITPQILYGEDADRNGLLTENEDDGDASFPLDNEDGILDGGLYPYLTVNSYEDNVSNDNRPRIYLFGDQTVVREQVTEVFEDEPEVVNFILNFVAGSRGAARGQRGGANGSRDGGAQPTGGAGTNADNGGVDTGAPGVGTGNAEPDKSDSRRQRRPQRGNQLQQNGDATIGAGDAAESGNGDSPPDGTASQDAAAGAQEETGDARNTTGPISTPVSLLLPRDPSGSLTTGPVKLEHLARLLDRTTVIGPDQPRLEGLINVNTAPRRVLELIEGLSDDQINRILEVRQTLDDESLATFAWLAVEEVVDLETLERIAPAITARGQQFTIESLGYADHVGMVTRLQVMVDMAGPIAQTIYYRDVSYLGGGFPIREQDLERVRGR